MSSPDCPDRLDRAIAALKADISTAAPPATVDTAIAAAIARAGERRRFVPRWPAWAWVIAPGVIAAAVALIVIVHRAALDDAPDDRPVAPSRAEASGSATATQFMPVVSMAELEQSGNTLIVPARLPRMTLAELGLPVNPARAADAIDTELLVRRDGTLLAVRFTY